jgi:hypothetical protein
MPQHAITPTRTLPLAYERYRAWTGARDDARAAFRRWCAANVDDRADAYAAYRAAADREDAAADWFLRFEA